MNTKGFIAMVTKGNATHPFQPTTRGPLLQRKCACGQHTIAGGECEACRRKREATLQRASLHPSSFIPHPSEVPPIVYEVLRSPGQPLDAETRAFMEPRFGHDFSGVRVHTDAQAAESARAVNALAYTVGREVVFGAGQYTPGMNEGRRLLAHELTHVVQQSEARAGVQRLSSLEHRDDTPLEREAEAQAMQVVTGRLSGQVQVQRRLNITRLQRVCDRGSPPAGMGCNPATDMQGAEAVILFPFDSADLSSSQKAGIAAYISSWHASGADASVRVDGFASCDGGAEHNWRLSCDRALQVAAEMYTPSEIDTGIDPDYITVFAHGETDEFSETSLEANRRVIITTTLAPPTPTPIPTPTPSPTPTPTPPSSPSPTIEDCLPWQTTMLTNHLASARTWVNDAERKIAAYAYVFASPRHSAVPRSPEVAGIVRAALVDNFHTTSAGHVRTIAENFASLKAALNAALDLECVSSFWCDDNDLAYVRGRFAWLRRLGDVNVCPLWFRCGNDFKRTSTIIHEVAHQYPGAEDNAYEWQSSYATLLPAQAIDNAEAYAVASRQIYHGGSHGPGERC